jgi:hypothetical protein
MIWPIITNATCDRAFTSDALKLLGRALSPNAEGWVDPQPKYKKCVPWPPMSAKIGALSKKRHTTKKVHSSSSANTTELKIHSQNVHKVSRMSQTLRPSSTSLVRKTYTHIASKKPGFKEISHMS